VKKHVLVSTLCICLSAVTAFAHHGTGIAYDNTKPTVISGIVKEFSWTNPHAHLILEVKDGKGQASEYAVEMNSPGVMQRQGWTRRQFSVGDQVQITVYPAKVGTPIGSCIGTCKVTINGVDRTPKAEVREGL
jgi:hypothetical protein